MVIPIAGVFGIAIELLLAFFSGETVAFTPADNPSVTLANASAKAAEDFAVLISPAPDTIVNVRPYLNYKKKERGRTVGTHGRHRVYSVHRVGTARRPRPRTYTLRAEQRLRAVEGRDQGVVSRALRWARVYTSCIVSYASRARRPVQGV